MLVRRPYTGFPDYPDGQIRTNVLDMSKYLWSLLNNGRSLTNGQILRPETLRRILTPFVPNDNMGLHFFFTELDGGDTAWGHAGGLDDAAAEMNFVRSGSDSIGVIFMANTSMSSASSAALWRSLIDIGRDIAPNPRNPVQCTLSTSLRETTRQTQNLRVGISPNPASEQLSVRFAEQNITGKGVLVRLVDVLGRTVFSQQDVHGDVQIPLSNIAQGSYYLVVSDGGSILATKQIVKM
jgi:hypothetical protein